MLKFKDIQPITSVYDTETVQSIQKYSVMLKDKAYSLKELDEDIGDLVTDFEIKFRKSMTTLHAHFMETWHSNQQNDYAHRNSVKLFDNMKKEYFAALLLHAALCPQKTKFRLLSSKEATEKLYLLNDSFKDANKIVSYLLARPLEYYLDEDSDNVFKRVYLAESYAQCYLGTDLVHLVHRLHSDNSVKIFAIGEDEYTELENIDLKNLIGIDVVGDLDFLLQAFLNEPYPNIDELKAKILPKNLNAVKANRVKQNLLLIEQKVKQSKRLNGQK